MILHRETQTLIRTYPDKPNEYFTLAIPKFIEFTFDAETIFEQKSFVTLKEPLYLPRICYSDFNTSQISFQLGDTQDEAEESTPFPYSELITKEYIKGVMIVKGTINRPFRPKIVFKAYTPTTSVFPFDHVFRVSNPQVDIFLEYSMRRLRYSYTDPAVRVFSGNSSSVYGDIFFDASGNISDSSTVTFVSASTTSTTTFATFRSNIGATNGLNGVGTSMRVGRWYNQTGSNVIAAQDTITNRPYLISDSTMNGTWKIEFGRGGANLFLQTPEFGTVYETDGVTVRSADPTGFDYDGFTFMAVCKSNRIYSSDNQVTGVNERIVAKQFNYTPVSGNIVPPTSVNSGKTGISNAIREFVMVLFGAGVGTNPIFPPTGNTETGDDRFRNNYNIFVENQNPAYTGYTSPAMNNNQPITPSITNANSLRSGTTMWNTQNSTSDIVNPNRNSDTKIPERQHIVTTTLSLLNGGRMRIFVNNYLENEATGVTTDKTRCPFLIGSAGSSFGSPYTGNISEVRLYKRELSNSEINTINQNIKNYFNIINVKT